MHFKNVFISLLLILGCSMCLSAQSPTWSHFYDGPDSHDDAGYAITHGADGNIYVAGLSNRNATGYDLFAMSLSAPGDTNWTYTASGSYWWELAKAIVYGADDNVYVAGGVSGGIYVVSLTAAGDTNWTYYLFGGSYEGGRAEAIVYGEDGNLYVAGATDEIQGKDFVVASVTTSGSERWVYKYNGAQNGFDWAHNLVYGDDDNIYAVGYSQEGSGSRWFVASLDTAGGERWTRKDFFSGTECYSIVYGSDDNIYFGGNNGNGFAVMSLDTANGYRWTYQHFDVMSTARDIIQGPNGLLYAAGSSTHSGGTAIAVACLDTAGTEQWLFKYDTTAYDEGLAEGIAYGIDGNLYIGGMIGDTISSEQDYIVLSIDTLGAERWAWIHDQDGQQDWCEAFCLGSDGNIYATGRANDSTTSTDIMTVCFDVLPPAAPLLIYPPDDTTISDTMVTFVWHAAVDSGSFIDHYVLEYDTDSLFSSPGGGTPADTFFAAVLTDTTYYWRVQAVDGGNNSSPYSAVWSFTISLGGTEEFPVKKPELSLRIRNNPSAGRVLFSLNMPEAAPATLKIYDASGRLIDTPLNRKLSAGMHALAWTPEAAGIYFCVIEVGETRLSQKFIIVE